MNAPLQIDANTKFTQANGLELAYSTFGNPSHPALLLIMGLGAQMIVWDERFCEQLASCGFYVIRFDNRDVGLSEKLHDLKPVGAVRMFMMQELHIPLRAPYSLFDMANDAVGLLDSLGIKQAHIMGASMGGMIAQIIASTFQQRALSLISVMSSSGARKHMRPSRQARKVLTQKPAKDRQKLIKQTADAYRFIASKTYPLSEAELRSRVERAMNRSYYPLGYKRQLNAIFASYKRTALLSDVTAPTLVIHGDEDSLVPIAAGKDTADRITNARFELIKGMGHDMPIQVWTQIIDLVCQTTLQSKPTSN